MAGGGLSGFFTRCKENPVRRNKQIGMSDVLSGLVFVFFNGGPEFEVIFFDF